MPSRSSAVLAHISHRTPLFPPTPPSLVCTLACTLSPFCPASFSCRLSGSIFLLYVSNLPPSWLSPAVSPTWFIVVSSRLPPLRGCSQVYISVVSPTLVVSQHAHGIIHVVHLWRISHLIIISAQSKSYNVCPCEPGVIFLVHLLSHRSCGNLRRLGWRDFRLDNTTMCYQLVERYSACRCLYYEHAVDRCPSYGRRGHGITRRTILVGYTCNLHAQHDSRYVSYDQPIYSDSGSHSGHSSKSSHRQYR
jgi:hypothetical protein